MAGPQVRRLRRRQIDDVKWDAAVRNDPNPLPYGFSWWLDAATAENWQGLVLDDYRVVLPLPRLRRFRILPTIIRPPYTQQLGPYGDVRGGDVGALLNSLPHTPQLALPLRPSIAVHEIPTRYAYRRRINYVLDLTMPYQEVQAQFPKKLRQYLRRSVADRLEPIAVDELVALCRDRLGGRGGVRSFHFERLQTLIEACERQDSGSCYQLTEQGELLAAGFYPRQDNRIFNLAAASTEVGLRRRGMSRLLSLVFQTIAGQPGAAFDFEGSELPGVREYFAKFGGQDEGYYVVERKWAILP